MSGIIDRILADLGDPDLVSKLQGLSPSQLNSLLLEVFQEKAERLTPPALLRNFEENRFVRPSSLDPLVCLRLTLELLEEADRQGISPVLLSPAAPLGSASAFGCVDQRKVVSALRGTELLSDPTNLLALILAGQVRRGKDNREGLHLCAAAGVTRAQGYSGGKNFSTFGLFGLVSSGRDMGSYRCEQALLLKHLLFYRTFLEKRGLTGLSITLRRRGGYPDGEGFFRRMAEFVRERFPGVPLILAEENSDNQYYLGLNFKLRLQTGDGSFEVGDGGFTDWTQRLLGDKKERCLISGAGLERLI